MCHIQEVVSSILTLPTMFNNPLVVGYKGEIGLFILNGLLRIMPKALNIWCFDINETEEEKIERIKKADYIFLCVPIQDTVRWLLKYKHYLKDKIIVEQCSLKMFLNVPQLEDLKILSMHILFRPSATPNIKDRNCVVLQDNCTIEFIDKMKEVLQSKVTLVDWDYKAHDTRMAFKQALAHRVLMVLDETIGEEDSTYITKKVHELVERIKLGDKTLYSIIQDNKFLDEALQKFDELLKTFDLSKYMGG